MAVTKIEFVEEVGNRPEADSYGDYPEYQSFMVYKLVNDVGNDQFIKIAVNHDSYGGVAGFSRDAVTLAEAVTKLVTVWE